MSMSQVSLLVRGSIIDVYSFSNELPFRIDFFGDDIETIRKLWGGDAAVYREADTCWDCSRADNDVRREGAFPSVLPEDAVLAFKDFLYVRDTIDNIYQEGFTNQALTEKLEGKTELEQRELEVASVRKDNLCQPLVGWTMHLTSVV